MSATTIERKAPQMRAMRPHRLLLAADEGRDEDPRAGTIVAIDAGYAAPGATATGKIAAGLADETVDNTAGSAGALTIRVKPGIFKFVNLAGDPWSPLASARIVSSRTTRALRPPTVARLARALASSSNSTRTASGSSSASGSEEHTMGIDLTSSNLRSIQRGFVDAYKTAFAKAIPPWHLMLATVVPSTTSENVYAG